LQRSRHVEALEARTDDEDVDGQVAAELTAHLYES
jgi:hypothetical protein